MEKKLFNLFYETKECDFLQTPLASLYGAIEGLCELGPEVIKALVIPKIKSISDRIESSCIEGQGLSSVDKNGAGHIKTLLVVKNGFQYI